MFLGVCDSVATKQKGAEMIGTIAKEAVNPNHTKFVYVLYDYDVNLCTIGTLAECRNIKAGLESGLLTVVRTNNTTEVRFLTASR